MTAITDIIIKPYLENSIKMANLFHNIVETSSKLLDSTLLTPPGDVTKINRKDFRNLDRYVKPGDRIAWHRPYMLIHEAIVLKVDAEKSEIWVFERTKIGSSSSSSSNGGSSSSRSSSSNIHSNRNDDSNRSNSNSLADDDDGAPYGPGIAKITKVDLTAPAGQLYRYNDTDELTAILTLVLTNLDSKGYNLFSRNCQTLGSGTDTDGQNGTSHQTRWFVITQTMEAIGIPLFSEGLERYYKGGEWKGIISAGILHALAFVIELFAAILKFRRGHMSWGDFCTVITRQLFMHIVSWCGNYLSSFEGLRSVLQTSLILQFFLAIFFAIVADALLLYFGLDPDKMWVRYPVMAVAATAGFFLGKASAGVLLEFVVSMILGFVGKFIGHGLYHATSWLLAWLKSEKVNGRYVRQSTELKKGDVISIREGLRRRHVVFDECDNGKMKVIRNTYRKGVHNDVVPFHSNWVYQYDYPSEKVRSGEDVVRIANSKVGQNNYSFANYNSKTFAEQCKLNHVSTGSNTVDWKAHFHVLMSDRNISDSEKESFRAKFEKFEKMLSEETGSHEALGISDTDSPVIPEHQSEMDTRDQQLFRRSMTVSEDNISVFDTSQLGQSLRSSQILLS